MRVALPPSTRNDAEQASEDELDSLLQTFYRSELPNPWPALTAPRERNTILPFRPAKPRFTMSRTRWALAACVAFLVAGTLIVSPFLGGGNIETVKSTEPAALDASATTQPEPHVSFPQRPDGSVGDIRVDIPHVPNK
jgi:hypothetical protein